MYMQGDQIQAGKNLDLLHKQLQLLSAERFRLNVEVKSLGGVKVHEGCREYLVDLEPDLLPEGD